MTTTTVTNTVQTLIAAGTSNAAAATTRGVVDLRGKLGGILTMKITNGATGPTVQAEGRVLIAHNEASTPTAASAGANWKTIWRFGGGTTANAITEQSYEFGPGIMHMEVEFTGNTVQGVTVEAILSEITNSVTA